MLVHKCLSFVNGVVRPQRTVKSKHTSLPFVRKQFYLCTVANVRSTDEQMLRSTSRGLMLANSPKNPGHLQIGDQSSYASETDGAERQFTRSHVRTDHLWTVKCLLATYGSVESSLTQRWARCWILREHSAVKLLTNRRNQSGGRDRKMYSFVIVSSSSHFRSHQTFIGIAIVMYESSINVTHGVSNAVHLNLASKSRRLKGFVECLNQSRTNVELALKRNRCLLPPVTRYVAGVRIRVARMCKVVRRASRNDRVTRRHGSFVVASVATVQISFSKCSFIVVYVNRFRRCEAPASRRFCSASYRSSDIILKW